MLCRIIDVGVLSFSNRTACMCESAEHAGIHVSAHLEQSGTLGTSASTCELFADV